MKIKYFPLSLFLLLLLFSCGREQEKKDALAYYDKANMYYLNNQMDSAMFILDSLDIKFPNVLETKNMSLKLKRQIDKQSCKIIMDTLYTKVEQLKALRTILEHKGASKDEIISIDRRIDSLTAERNPFWARYKELDDEEFRSAACKQCVTRMQNLRNGYDGPIY